MTVEEVAELLRVRPEWVREIARRGELPSFKLGRYRRFNRMKVLDWLREQEGGAYKRERRSQ